MIRPSTFFFMIRRGVRNLGKHWAMTVACIASLSVCMTLNTFASLAEVNVDSMVNYLGSQNETVVYLDPDCDDKTAQSVGEKLSAMPGVTEVQYVSKQDVLNTYRGYMQDYSSLWDEFETDNPFKANYRVSISDLSQMEAMSKKMQDIPGVYSVTAPVEMTNVFVQIQRSVTRVGQGIVLVLMIVSIITVGSTIRLSVFARRREIEIMKYVGATNGLVTLPFVAEGLTMGLISGILTAAVSVGGYSYMVQASDGLGGVWQMIMGQALVPVSAVWPTILTYSLAGGALVGGLGSMFSIRKHLNVGPKGAEHETSNACGAAAFPPWLHSAPRKTRERKDPPDARRQPVCGCSLPAAERHGLPGFGGHRKLQHVQLAEQAEHPVQIHRPAQKGAVRREKEGRRRQSAGKRTERAGLGHSGSDHRSERADR